MSWWATAREHPANTDVNVHPSIHTHPKFIALQGAVGIGAMHYLTKLWGFCQSAQRGERIGKLSPQFIEALCCWSGEPGKLFLALTAKLTDKGAGWLVVEKGGEYVVHDWNAENYGLVSNWKNGASTKRKHSSGNGKATPEQRQGRAPAVPKQSQGDATALPRPLDRIGSDGSGSDGSGSGNTRAPMYPPPALAQVLEHARKSGWTYSVEEITRAFQSFEVAKVEDGSWFWGKKYVTDWRVGIELRCAEAADKNSPVNVNAVNSRIIGIERQLREMGDNPPPDQTQKWLQLQRERDGLIKEQQKATGQ